MTVASDTGGTYCTLTKLSGIIACDYLSIQDIHVGGGAGWYAGANSTNVSGNDGWTWASWLKKTINGLPCYLAKTINGLSIASAKTFDGLT